MRLPHDMNVIFGQPRVHASLLREFLGLLDGRVVIRTHGRGWLWDDADFVLDARSVLRNENVSVLRSPAVTPVQYLTARVSALI